MTGTTRLRRLSVVFAGTLICGFILHGGTLAKTKGRVSELIGFVESAVLSHYAREADAVKAGYLDDSLALPSASRRYVRIYDGAPQLTKPNAIIYGARGGPAKVEYWVFGDTSPSPPHLWGIDPSKWAWVGGYIDWASIGKDHRLVRRRYWSDGNVRGPGADAYPTKNDILEVAELSRLPNIVSVMSFPPAWHLYIDLKGRTLGTR